jgi:Fe-S-cluster containining protein
VVTPSVVIHVPSDLSYSCHHSGVCCTVFQHIPVDRQTAERIEHLPAAPFTSATKEIERPADALSYPEGFDREPVLRRRADGACVFLTPNHLCELHSVAGPEAKPVICREFPYLFRKTPGGIFVGLSFVCPSVRNNRGTPLADQLDELHARAAISPYLQEIEEPLPFTEQFLIDWATYEHIETYLVELLETATYPLAIRLTACHVSINMLDLFLKMQLGRPAVGTVAIAEPKVVLQYLTEARREAQRQRLWSIASKRASNARSRRVFFGLITSLFSLLWQQQRRSVALWRVSGIYLKALTGWGAVTLRPLARPVPFTVVNRVDLPSNGQAADLLCRYVRHCVFRKDLLIQGSLLRGLNHLLLTLGLLRWYAAGVAWCGERTTPSEEDWSLALQHVETYFARHSKLFALLERDPTIATLLDSFMARRNYPFLVVQ